MNFNPTLVRFQL